MNGQFHALRTIFLLSAITLAVVGPQVVSFGRWTEEILIASCGTLVLSTMGPFGERLHFWLVDRTCKRFLRTGEWPS